ncbi:hypothetical protein PV390_00525 [Streptomyces sp. ME02-6991-2A]|uniref:hypothetical protein n=1 Tax=Streptomyces sp. ME02-6991-2A TaxID=3028677 RepID=UPI0029A7FD54|nr:hypothetical protein [Streptomyces sp. ME02-6991-2A]MDX3372875.1 hypothetical protein [Streptomyces sp. ME02-6991-2A]
MSNHIEGGTFHSPVVQARTVHMHTSGAPVVGQPTDGSGLPFAEDEFARRVDLDRKALATARSIRRVVDADGLRTPWLHTPLTDVLEELDSPGTVAARIRSVAGTLRRWVGWNPPTEGFRQPTAKRVEAALAVWRGHEGDRAECLLAIEELATVLEGAPPGSARGDGSTITSVLERAASAAEAMGVVIRELCAAFKDPGPHDDLPFEHVSAERRMFSALEELQACRRRLAETGDDASLLARATGALLIAGGWGTGKSYGLGSWAEARVAAGAPVAFVSGQELGGEQWEEKIAGAAVQGGRSGPVRNLLAELQAHARASGKHATLVIDALNDVAALRGHELDGFASLSVLLREFPEVLLVASTRLDRRMSRDEGAVGRYGIHWARGVADPERAWEVLRDVYQVPALALPPDVAELRRPLMLAVLAWCLHQERDTVDSDAPVSVPSIGDLFERWLTIHDKHYFEYLHGRPPAACQPLVKRACALLGALMGLEGTLDHGSACAALRGEPELGEPVQLLEWLFQAGVLASDPQNQRIGFAVQRFAEHVWARNLMDGPGHRPKLASLVKDLSGPDETSHHAFRMLSALAGVMPRTDQKTGKKKELPHFLPKRLPSAAVMAVLDSLAGRHRDQVTDQSLRFLRRYTSDSELAPWVWYTVLVNSACPDHQAGAGFLHRELRGLNKHQLTSRFIVPMLHLLEDRDGMTMVQQFIRWVGHGTDKVRRNAADVTGVLLWLAAVPSPPLRAQCVRAVAQIWRDVPGAAIEQVEFFGKHHDAYIAEASWLAAYGALLLGRDEVPVEKWHAVMMRDGSRAHRGIQQTISSMRILLRPSSDIPCDEPRVGLPWAPPLPVSRRRLELCEWYFGSMVEKTDSHPRRYRWLVQRSRVLKPRRLEVKMRGRTGYRPGEWPAYVQQQKVLETALEEWHGSTESGLGGLRAWSELSVLDRRHGIDPTVPPGWPTSSAHLSRRSDSWWCAAVGEGGIADVLRGMQPSQFAMVRDPDGAAWYVLSAAYGLDRPDGVEREDRLPVLVTDRYTVLQLDGGLSSAPARPRTGRRHVRVEVETVLVRSTMGADAVATVLGTGESPQLSERLPPHMYLAEYFRRPGTALELSSGGETTAPSTAEYEDAYLVPLTDSAQGKPENRTVPSRALAELLDLHWSGRRLDFHLPGDEQPVLHDPGIEPHGPPALLMATAVTAALAAQGWNLAWRVTVTENLEFGRTIWTGLCGPHGEVLGGRDDRGERDGDWQVERLNYWRRY